MPATAIATTTDVVDRARELLHDNPTLSADRRWSDTVILRWVADAQREIVAVYPQYTINGSGEQPDTIPLTPPANTLALGANMTVHQICVPAILDYVMAMSMVKDSEEGNADIAAGYIKSFWEKLKL